ncbi:hypothetical protein HYH03_002802 [Edaphochlamys debaryana]|uniref:Uncharacterized protein n=1 Tax=Edaphochlamys debaryana TaxID=47281 RepID=A0A835YCT1_9CHLO|nr:hypothetical protein HYH03_002802 [Edaphochlamys debaryana]|eukprot:KAG2499222.1 hypothetical protein HYH03_002802 [Edaphochlamys debaryana]
MRSVTAALGPASRCGVRPSCCPRLLPAAAAHRRRPLATRIVARATPSDGGSSGAPRAPSPSPSAPSPSAPERLLASTEATAAELRRIAAVVEALAPPQPSSGSGAAGGGGGGDLQATALLLQQLIRQQERQADAAAEQVALLRHLAAAQGQQPQRETTSGASGSGDVAASDPASAPELRRMLGAAVEALGERQAAAAAEHTALLRQILAQQQEAAAQQAAAQTALLEQQAQHLASLRRDAVTARLQAALAVQCSANPPEAWAAAQTVLMEAIQGNQAALVSHEAISAGGQHSSAEELKEYLEGLTGLRVSYKSTDYWEGYNFKVELWREW